MDPRQQRRHHYLYAHRVLPPLAHGDPAGFCARLSNPGAGQASLEALWEQVGSEAPVRLEPTGLSLSQHVLSNGRPVFLIQLPPPQLMPEAYFVAILPSPDTLGYFALEYSQDFASGEPCTVIGGWSPTGDHANLGRGPEPTAEAFLARLGELTEDPSAA